ncbi:hypothetical protein SH1V18_02730 [Vallitalea longa]|uniref:DUF2569 domain-containing protein n=1 Tax=Vallitalea longa TaxID=2936439 RepID=A0A9W5YAM7_9FIRM|nr:DUF2569 family protein [Vallitalea longa]GKX27793.1 hypothetical protein SH1V18_02730 [Vallitalea longa]
MSQANEILIDEQCPNDGPQGIGGWLVLIVIGYIFSLLSTALMIFKIYNLYIDGTVAVLTEKKGDYYNPELYLLINYEMVINVLIFLFIVIILIFLFRKKRLYPKLAISLIIGSNIVVGLDHLFCNMIGLETTGVELAQYVGRLMTGVLWIVYFVKSKRVKYTFLN